jgi:hypothetical protein
MKHLDTHQSRPDLGVKVALRGQYRCVLNEGTERERDTGWFDNLITDIGLDRLAVVSPNIISFASIGTGTNAPANADTQLQAWVASATTPVLDTNANIGSPTYAGEIQVHWVYAQGAVVGNMAEVGVGWATGGVSLFSRARILDGSGNPTTLTVVSLDQLTVYYKLTVTPQITDVTGSVSISGTSYDYTGRLANAATFMANLSSVLTAGGGRWGLPSSAGGFAMKTYSTQTLGAITTVPSSMVLEWANTQATFQYSLAATSGGAALPKDNTKTFTIVGRFAWDRV